MIKLRKWQEEAFMVFKDKVKTERQFYTVAAVGSGKTIFSAVCASYFLSSRKNAKIIIIAPQRIVKKQWSDTFQRLGLHIDYDYNGGLLRNGYQGVSVTYAGLVYSLLDLVGIVDENTLVILDEIHHTNTSKKINENAWGKAVAYLEQKAKPGFVLDLSGTPWRTDEKQILFTPYVQDDDERLWVKPDFSYTYSEAVRDRVNRPVIFDFFGGTMTLEEKGVKRIVSFKDIEYEDQRTVLTAALEGDWIFAILDKFYSDLTNAREKQIGSKFLSGGLIVCKDQASARTIKKLVDQRYGINACLVKIGRAHV